MRIKIENKEKPEYTKGDTRVVKRFLLFPLRIDNEIRWLETARIVQEYMATTCFDPDGHSFDCYKWRNIGWIKDDK